MAIEEPEVGFDVEFGDGAPLAELAAVEADLGDAVHHQHRRRRKLRITRTEVFAAAGLQQVLLGILGLRGVEFVWVPHGDATLSEVAGGRSQATASCPATVSGGRRRALTTKIQIFSVGALRSGRWTLVRAPMSAGRIPPIIRAIV